ASVVGLPLTGYQLGEITPTIIGVVKDFNFESLRSPIEPLLMHIDPATPIRRIFVRIRPENIPATIQALERHWLAIAPDAPFQYAFLDENVDRQYRAEQLQIQISVVATSLAILIACLGLFGLSVLAANRRTKEIGIRKVLGASVTGILVLMSKDFTRLVAIAFVVASPLAYFAMNFWLQNFAYRTGIAWWVFVLAGGLALAIALLTVSTQAIRAALANPVEALRYE
ncbi:MAG: ABC transporter permease, partial [bacterium]